MNSFHSLLLLIAFTSTVFSAPILDIKAIAGKSQKEVQAVLGAPSSSEKTKHGPKLIFKGATIEVVFIGGKADWITITLKETVPFTKHALAEFGIPTSEPKVSNSNVIRWEPCGDYVSVSIFPAPGKVDYAYIKVATK